MRNLQNFRNFLIGMTLTVLIFLGYVYFMAPANKQTQQGGVTVSPPTTVTTTPTAGTEAGATVASVAAQTSTVLYSRAMIVITYADGSTEIVSTPITTLDKISMTLTDFFEKLIISKDQKPVNSFSYKLEQWSANDIGITVKAKITKTAGSASSIISINKGYVLKANTPVTLYNETVTASALESMLADGSYNLTYSAVVYVATDVSVYKAVLDVSVPFTRSTPIQPAPQPQTATVSTTTSSGTASVQTTSATVTTTTTTGTATSSGVYVPPVQGMTSDQYVQTVEEFTGKPYTDQITVQTRDGGYQPTPGTLAAQDQYSYDVTDLFMTLRSTGQPPPNWTSYTVGDKTVFVNPDTGSQVVVSSDVNWR
jgi:hypothetical protein